MISKKLAAGVHNEFETERLLFLNSTSMESIWLFGSNLGNLRSIVVSTSLCMKTPQLTVATVTRRVYFEYLHLCFSFK